MDASRARLVHGGAERRGNLEAVTHRRRSVRPDFHEIQRTRLHYLSRPGPGGRGLFFNQYFEDGDRSPPAETGAKGADGPIGEDQSPIPDALQTADDPLFG